MSTRKLTQHLHAPDVTAMDRGREGRREGRNATLSYSPFLVPPPPPLPSSLIRREQIRQRMVVGDASVHVCPPVNVKAIPLMPEHRSAATRCMYGYLLYLYLAHVYSYFPWIAGAARGLRADRSVPKSDGIG